MKTTILAALACGSLILLAGAAVAVGLLDVKPPRAPGAVRQARPAREFEDAYEGYRALALDPKDDPKLVGRDMRQAISCLLRLGRVDEVDAFREAVIRSTRTTGD